MNEEQTALSSAETETAKAGDRAAAVAPWWHTVLMVLLIIGLSAGGAGQMRNVQNRPVHLIPNYLFATAFEWALAGLAWWGIHLRGVPRQRLLGEWRPGARGWLNDLGAAILFWLAALLVLSALGQAMRYGLGGKADPGQIAHVTLKLAPTTGVEMMLFLILSVSAGICEEFVFRGYLQQQFSTVGGRTWIGVVLAAVVFGCAHGYEGIAGILLITAYGAMFGILAVYRRGLRTGMIAHAWHDAVSGIALVLLRHHQFHLGAK